jgi:hypothetical protein
LRPPRSDRSGNTFSLLQLTICLLQRSGSDGLTPHSQHTMQRCNAATCNAAAASVGHAVATQWCRGAGPPRGDSCRSATCQRGRLQHPCCSSARRVATYNARRPSAGGTAVLAGDGGERRADPCDSAREQVGLARGRHGVVPRGTDILSTSMFGHLSISIYLCTHPRAHTHTHTHVHVFARAGGIDGAHVLREQILELDHLKRESAPGPPPAHLSQRHPSQPRLAATA